jgi:hypothetical protein
LIDVKDNTAYVIDVKQTPATSKDSKANFYIQQITDNKNVTK